MITSDSIDCLYFILSPQYTRHVVLGVSQREGISSGSYNTRSYHQSGILLAISFIFSYWRQEVTWETESLRTDIEFINVLIQSKIEIS
jgi:hypothetical protein